VKKWCCEALDRLIMQAGEKGISVAAFKDGQYRSFYILACPFEKNIIQEFNTLNNNGKVSCPKLLDSNGNIIPIVSYIYTPITFCSFCGSDLSNVIQNNCQRFDKIAAKHSMFF
jgi:hypothetical protein